MSVAFPGLKNNIVVPSIGAAKTLETRVFPNVVNVYLARNTYLFFVFVPRRLYRRRGQAMHDEAATFFDKLREFVKGPEKES